jgi:flagellar protein FliS
MMTASSFAAGRAARHLYRQVAVSSQTDDAVDAHHLVTLLFDGLFESIAQGRGAIQRGDIQTKCKALTRAVAIVDQGLRAALDLRQGGPLARDLNDLYGYVTMRLTRANLDNNLAALDECARLMQPLAEAWASIRPAPNGDTRGA